MELVELYRDEALRDVIGKDKEREIDVGRVRACERILQAISVAPPTIHDYRIENGNRE